MNENRKIRFNIVDVIIILLIIACVVGVVLRGTIKEKISQTISTEVAYVTLVAENVPEEFLELFEDADKVYSNSEELGLMISNAYKEQTEIVLDLNEKYEYKEIDDGNGNYIKIVEKTVSPEFEKATNPNTYTVTCQIQVNGQDKNDGFYLRGVDYIGVGKMLNISIENHSFTMIITKISDKAS